MKLSVRFILTLLSLFIVLGITIPPWKLEEPVSIGKTLGTQDFVQYWSAFQLARENKNPYDPKLVLGLEQSIDPTIQSAVVMWTPPWLLILLKPILALQFTTAVCVWCVVNIFFFVSSIGIVALLVQKFQNAPLKVSQELFMIPAGILFYPALDCFYSGQIGLLLLWVFSVFLLSLTYKIDLIAGVLLSILTLKVHLFYLLVIPLSVTIITSKRWKILSGALIGGLSLYGTTLTLGQNLPQEWVQSIINPINIQFTVPLTEWRGETLVAFIRGIMFDNYGNRMDWLMVALPLLILFGSAKYFIVNSKRFPIEQTLGLVALPFSLLSAPYGWFSDFALLVLPQLLLIGRSTSIIFTIFLIGFQLSFYFASALSNSAHGYGFLIPLTLGIAGVFHIHKKV